MEYFCSLEFFGFSVFQFFKTDVLSEGDKAARFLLVNR